ncbi:MAG: type I 3-dehydroquinate dehydratase [Bacteroidales bacterium]
MICISIGKMNLIREVNALQPSLVEIRYDLIRKQPDQVVDKLNQSILQVATCRPGHYSDMQRMEILKQAIDIGAVYVDIEIESSHDFIREISSYAKQRKTHLIISYHNLTETPVREKLHEILKSCYSAGADIAKIACAVNNKRDNARLLALYDEAGRKIVLGMGDKGRITRLAALDLGAEFSFAALSDEEETAPGQLSYNELLMLQKKLHDR